MTHYLLDTNIVSYLADARSPNHDSVLRAFRALRDEDVVSLSVLSLYEIEYGFAHGSPQLMSDKFTALKESLLPAFNFLPLSQLGAEIFGQLKSGFRQSLGLEPQNSKKTQKNLIDVHTVDLMVASSALEHQATLVSNDRIFERLHQIEPKLKIQNWVS